MLACQVLLAFIFNACMGIGNNYEKSLGQAIALSSVQQVYHGLKFVYSIVDGLNLIRMFQLKKMFSFFSCVS